MVAVDRVESSSFNGDVPKQSQKQTDTDRKTTIVASKLKDVPVSSKAQWSDRVITWLKESWLGKLFLRFFRYFFPVKKESSVELAVQHSGLKGLSNFCLNCYMNAACQCLLSVGSFVRMVEEADNDDLPSETKALREAFSAFVKAYKQKGGVSRSHLEKLLRAFLSSPNNDLSLNDWGKQLDAAEFISTIFWAFESSLQHIMQAEFEGRRVNYSTMAHPSVILDLQKGEESKIFDALLNGFIKEEMDEDWYFSENGQNRLISQYTKITKINQSPPPFLVVQLGRFEGGIDGPLQKRNTPIIFGEEKKDLSALFNPDVLGDQKAIYRLKGCVNHSGNINGGHYTADVEKGGRWYCCNDSIITLISGTKRLKQPNKSVYCYIFERT